MNRVKPQLILQILNLSQIFYIREVTTIIYPFKKHCNINKIKTSTVTLVKISVRERSNERHQDLWILMGPEKSFVSGN